MKRIIIQQYERAHIFNIIYLELYKQSVAGLLLIYKNRMYIDWTTAVI